MVYRKEAMFGLSVPVYPDRAWVLNGRINIIPIVRWDAVKNVLIDVEKKVFNSKARFRRQCCDCKLNLQILITEAEVFSRYLDKRSTAIPPACE